MTDETTVADRSPDVAEPIMPAPSSASSSRPRLLTAAEILAHTDRNKLEYVDVAVPEWTPAGAEHPATVRLRVMTGDEAIEFAEHQAATAEYQRRIAAGHPQPGKPPRRDAIMRLVCACAVDEQGDALFTPTQLEQLGALSFAVLQRLQDKALVLNGFATEDEAQESAKNG